MFDALSRAELYRGLSDEHHNVAAATNISTECRNRYVRMAEHYDALAETEEHLALAHASGC
jgi:predicted kinase